MGSSDYFDAFPGRNEPLPRIYIPIWPEGAPYKSLALFDPGAHYCLLNEDDARFIHDHLTQLIGSADFQTAHGRIEGKIYSHTLRFVADEGEDLDIDARILIASGWQAPSVVGYVGLLDRLRFAVDPMINRFYFGQLG